MPPEVVGDKKSGLLLQSAAMRINPISKESGTLKKVRLNSFFRVGFGSFCVSVCFCVCAFVTCKSPPPPLQSKGRRDVEGGEDRGGRESGIQERDTVIKQS